MVEEDLDPYVRTVAIQLPGTTYIFMCDCYCAMYDSGYIQ